MKILIIQGHPDSDESHFCHALEKAYKEGALESENNIRRLQIAKMDLPILRSKEDWEHGEVTECILKAQSDISWADHLVFFFPLWLGDMPALLKVFLEQVARPKFAFSDEEANPFTHKKLSGRTAHVFVTMGMPRSMYRWYFQAHSVKSLERNILSFIGIKPIHRSLIGMVDKMNEETAKKWLKKAENYGKKMC